MNYRMILQTLGRVLGIECLLMTLPLGVCVLYGESPLSFILSILITGACAAALLCIKPSTSVIFAREGFVIVALSWIFVSIFGALPFVFDGCIPHYVDAVFEIVSGFTTTGSSILTNVEALGKGVLFWRSFSHWVGGMGVLVFVFAVLPLSSEQSMHIMRAEVPGPTVGKLVPRMRKTAKILYSMYIVLTVILVILLVLGKMPLFDALVHAFGTAGTGGFGIKNTSIGYYNSAYIDIVIGVFMMLFGINFNLFYLLMLGKIKDALKNEELRWYLGIIVFSMLTIALNILSTYQSFAISLRHAFFQVSSIITTTGFSTVNFDLWPEYSRSLLVLLMIIGACAGSTGGGLKVSRLVILLKSSAREIKRMLHPREVSLVKLDSHNVDAGTVQGVLVYFMLYMSIIFASILIVSLDGLDFTTCVTSVISCTGNIGPALSLAGPAGNYSLFSDLSKIVLSLDMLIGRLEIFPILMLFSRGSVNAPKHH